MLPKNNRINKDLFADVLKKGVVLHSPLFSFRFVKEDLGSLRIAFVVSKKVALNATDRNKMKRRGYSAVRDILKHSPPKRRVIGAFFYKKDGGNAQFSVIRSEIEALLRKAGVV